MSQVLLDVMPAYDCVVLVWTEGALDLTVFAKETLRKEPNVATSPGAYGTLIHKGEGWLKVIVSLFGFDMRPSCSENFTVTTSYSSMDL